MKALCPETGSIPFSLLQWIPLFGETTVEYAHGDEQAQAICDATACPVEDCTRKIYVSTDNPSFVTVLSRRANRTLYNEKLKREAENEQLEKEVYELMKRDGYIK